MNEQIKTLAEQLGADEVKLPHGYRYALVGEENIQKFAELIVRECARKIGDLMDFTDYPDDTEKSMVELKTLRDARQVIKEHFGVK